MTPLGIRFLSPLACANTIRRAIKDVDIRPESLYWNLSHTRILDLQRSRPRVLICGPSGVGKSTLINEVLGEEVVSPVCYLAYQPSTRRNLEVIVTCKLWS